MLFDGLEEILNSTLPIAAKEVTEAREQIEIEVRFKTPHREGSAGIEFEDTFRRTLFSFRDYIRDPVRADDWTPVPSSGEYQKDFVKYYVGDIRSIQKEKETTIRYERKRTTTGSPIRSTKWPITVNISGESSNVQTDAIVGLSSDSESERRRTRWSFAYSPSSGNYKKYLQVDFTRTHFIKNSTEMLEFEIEIEASPDMDFGTFTKVENGWAYTGLHTAMDEVFKTLMRSIQNTPILYSSVTRADVIRSINTAFNPKSSNEVQIPSFFVNKPRTLEWRDFDRNTEFSLFPVEGVKEPAFAVTIKTDGTRVFVYYHSSGIYLFNPLGGTLIRISEKSPSVLEGCMLDGELLENFTVWVFDCLFVSLRGKGVDEVADYRQKPLLQRLQGMRYICRIQSENNDGAVKLTLVPKTFEPFFDRESFYEANKRAFKQNMSGAKELFKSDGLVYTDMGPYLRDLQPKCGCRFKDKDCKTCRSFNPSINRKFKPVELLTTDFIVKLNEAEEVELHASVGAGKTRPFAGTREFYVHPSQFQREFYEGETLVQVEPNKIYEFQWNKSESLWVPLRHRGDRLVPNNMDTAVANWGVVHNDIPKGVLVGKVKGKKALHLLRIYQNYVKIVTLNDLSRTIKAKLAHKKEVRKPRLFDIGSSYGGDVKKWKATDFDVYALEPDPVRVESITSRATEQGILERIQILNMRIQDYQKIEPKIGTTIQKVDVVTSFHSMTLIYDTVESIRDFVRTLKAVLKIGGTFVCMAMDGGAIHAQLGNYKQLTMEGIKIQRSKDDARKILVKMVTSDASLAKGQSEHLVDFDHLISTLEAEGFELMRDDHLTTAALLNDSELWWSQMTRMIEMRYVGAKALPIIDQRLQMLTNLLSGTLRSSQVETDQKVEVNANSIMVVSPTPGEKFWLVGTLAGGSSFFHSLLWCIDLKYRHAKGNVNLRFDRVFKLRNELAATMGIEDVPSDIRSDTGMFSIKTLKETMAEYTLHCGNFMIPFVERVLDVNVHVLSWVDDQLVPVRDVKPSFKSERSNVILHCSSNGRFEPLGRSLSGQEQIASFVFSSGDIIITNLMK